MSISAPTVLTADGSGTDATQYTTASVAPAASSLLMLFVGHGASVAGDNVVPTIGGALGLSWTQVITDVNSSNLFRGTWFRASTGAVPPSGTVDINFSTLQGNCHWQLIQVIGANNSSPIVQSASAQFVSSTTPSVNLPVAAQSTSLVLGAVARNGLTPYTEGAGHTMLSSVAGFSGPTVGSDVSYDLVSPVQTVAFSTAGSVNKTVFAVEIAQSSTITLENQIKAVLSQIATDVKTLQSAGGGAVGTKVTALPTVGALDGTESLLFVQGGVSEVGPVSLVRPWNEQILTTTYVNATLTATDVFAGFTPAANTRYLVDVLLSVQSNAATTGVQTAILGPSTGITRAGVKIISATTATADMISHIGALNTYQVATAGLTTPNLLSIQAIIEVGTPGAGNIRVGCKSEVAIATAVQIFPGSSMRWRAM